MGTRAPSSDGPDVGGAALVRVKKGSDDDDDDDDDGSSPDVIGMEMTALSAAAPECIGKACTPSDVPGVS